MVLSALDMSEEGLEDCFVVERNPQCAVFPEKKTNNDISHNSYHLLNGFPHKPGSGRISQFPAALFLKGMQREAFSLQLLLLLEVVEKVAMLSLLLFFLFFRVLTFVLPDSFQP